VIRRTRDSSGIQIDRNSHVRARAARTDFEVSGGSDIKSLTAENTQAGQGQLTSRIRRRRSHTGYTDLPTRRRKILNTNPSPADGCWIEAVQLHVGYGLHCKSFYLHILQRGRRRFDAFWRRLSAAKHKKF
jgi:hypothetical protein